MTTIVNSPGPQNQPDSGMGIVVGVIVALILVALFFLYIVPALRGSGAPAQPNGIDVNVHLPAGTSSSSAQ